MTSDASRAAPSSMNFLILAVLTLGLGWLLAMNPDLKFQGATVFLFVMLGWLVSVCLHEWGHAIVAHLGGDTSVRARGYLTLDPFHYTNPTTSIVMPLLIVALGGIGFPGGAVYVRHDLLRSDAWRVATYLAGPAMTGVSALVLALAYGARGAADGSAPFWDAVALLVFLQTTAFFLNLLPLPGLDGFGALSVFLPIEARRAVAQFAPMVMIAFIITVMSVPGAIEPLFKAAFGVTDGLGVRRIDIGHGLDRFQFWN